MSLIDEILLSETGQNMIDIVSEVYNDAFTGLWIFEAIGREYDRIQSLVEDVVRQETPETATWSINYWEGRYGINGDSAAALQDRRDAVVAKRTILIARNPELFRRALQAISGVNVRLDEHYGDYTFAVYLQSASRVSEDEIHSYIRRMKPSHLSYALLYECYSEAIQYQANVVTWFGHITVKQAY